MDKVTICTSWDGKDYYPAEYVERLYRGVCRNTTVPFDFVLFAGPDVKGGQFGEDIYIAQTGKSYWWPGMFFWMKNPPGVQTKTKLYIEIDVVIVGNLDTIIKWPSDHCYSRDWQGTTMPRGRENEANPGVALIRGGADSYVWDEYVKAGMPNWNPHDKAAAKSPLRMAAQGIINEKKQTYDLFPEDICASYKYKVKKEGLPPDCVTVHFHGRPGPHEVGEQWVKDNWR